MIQYKAENWEGYGTLAKKGMEVIQKTNMLTRKEALQALDITPENYNLSVEKHRNNATTEVAQELDQIELKVTKAWHQRDQHNMKKADCVKAFIFFMKEEQKIKEQIA